MTALPGWSVRLSEAVFCCDCRVVFSNREQTCPKCGALFGITPVDSEAPAREIARLRDCLTLATLAFRQIALGSHGAQFKSALARKALKTLPSTEPTPLSVAIAREG